MKKVLMLPLLAAALVAGACEEDNDPIQVSTSANVRFVNAVTGLSGNTVFTANGSMAGTPLAFGQQTSQCMTINSGSAIPIAFGTSNTAGTGINGTALTTANQNLTAGGNFTIIAAGSNTNPQIFRLDNAFSGTVGSTQAAVRFINLAPGTGTTANTFNVFTGASTTGSPTASSIAFGSPTTFNTMTSGTNAFTITNSTGTTLVTGSAGTLNLQGGTVNTIAIIPSPISGGVQLITIPRC